MIIMKTIREFFKILGQIYLSLILILFIGTFINAETVEIGGALTKINIENGLISAELDSVVLNTVLKIRHSKGNEKALYGVCCYF
jgi:hypothetical protein